MVRASTASELALTGAPARRSDLPNGADDDGPATRTT